MRNRISRAALAAACACAPLFAAGSASAITIEPSFDAFGLANTLFLNVGGLVVNSASLSGEMGQAGKYLNLAGTYGLPNAGIVFSSGNVSDYATGGNFETGRTTAYGPSGTGVAATAEQDAQLGGITGQSSHFDVVQLDIEFFAAANVSSVTFFGTFGSEEWQEWVGSGYIDGFGMFVNGVNVAGVTPTGGGPLQAVNINHPDMRGIAGTELDGILAPNGNPVLRFDVPVNPGQMNDFRLILGDASDGVLDTTVYLSSFFSEGGGGDPTGATEFDPLLPSNPPGPNGEYVILLPAIPAGQVIWVDPPVATGYEYTVEGTEFATITAPSLATVADVDGYFVTIGSTTVALAAGATINLLDAFGFTASAFTLSGIDPLLGLDPDNPAAFPLGVSFTGDVDLNKLTFTPITDSVSAVPLPAGLPLYLGAVALGGLILRRSKRARPA